MAPKKPKGTASAVPLSSSVEDLLLQALERDDNSMQTGRHLITYREGGIEDGEKALKEMGFLVADARDFADQAVTLEDTGDAEALVFPEIGVAVVSGGAMDAHGMDAEAEIVGPGPVEFVEPEYFAFAESSEYLRGFVSAATRIAEDLKAGLPTEEEEEVEAEVLGATWGLRACRVPPSVRSGVGIKVAVLDTGMDLGHPDFAGRVFVTRSFVGQPVQDLNGHGTHCIGTACGPRAPAGSIPRYGIGFGTRIFVGKVLTNSGSGTGDPRNGMALHEGRPAGSSTVKHR
ncbi:MAG: S8 family serine peptidase [Bryobacterales bacterium]|nr:S8 family serine peptidase [Bryobacterales bacterium]